MSDKQLPAGAIRIRVLRLYGGSPPEGTVLVVQRTAFVDGLVREGLVAVLDLPTAITSPGPTTDPLGGGAGG